MWTLSVVAAKETSQEVAQLDSLMLFGFLSVFLTLVFYINQHHSRANGIAFALCLAATAVYGFMQGAWPLGMIQTAWCAMTVKRFFKPTRKSTEYRQPRLVRVERIVNPIDMESRISRMFGPR
jgi:hypothetical protein